MTKWLRPPHLWDLCIFAGAMAFVAGCGWIYAPLAPIIAGLALAALGLWGARIWARSGRE